MNDDIVLLKWITASETNNYGFEIERISSKSSLVQGWEGIGVVERKGTTTQENIYNYNDETLETGEYHYRLKQIEYDGRFEYGNEVQVIIEINFDFNLEQNYPNPFNPTTTISYSIEMQDLFN